MIPENLEWMHTQDDNANTKDYLSALDKDAVIHTSSLDIGPSE